MKMVGSAAMHRPQTPQQKKWETIFQRFDPERPPMDPAWHVPRTQRSIKSILRALDRRHTVPRFLLPGTIGTGKTTELRRIAEDRTKQEFVVVLDLERHFNEVVNDRPALYNVSTWEVCFLAALYVLREAKERLGFDLPKEHLQSLEWNWSRLAQAAGETTNTPQIDIGKMLSLTFSAAAVIAAPTVAALGTGLQAASAVANAVKWVWPMGLGKKTVSDQDVAVQSLLTAVNITLTLVASACPEQRVLIIIDGLDKIHDGDRARELFVQSNLISQLDCCLIVACPFALRHDLSLGSSLGFTRVPPLMNEPVMRQDDPREPGPGIAFICNIFEHRVRDLGKLESMISRSQLEKLAYHSGGRARDFVKFVRVLSELAWDESVEAVTDAIVDETLDDMRREREIGINRGHIELLRAVMEDSEHRLPDALLTQELLKFSLLLPYSNGSEWYYPHPLLQMHMLPSKDGGSSASSVS